jgi:hypothetical protein
LVQVKKGKASRAAAVNASAPIFLRVVTWVTDALGGNALVETRLIGEADHVAFLSGSK